MPREQDIEQAVRHLEKTVVDREYKRYRIINRSDDISIQALFELFGNLVRELIQAPASVTEQHRQIQMDSYATALGHCFRWIAQEDEYTVLPDAPSYRRIMQEAHELLLWAERYHDLYLDHVAWGKDEKVAAVDEGRRIVEFRYKNPLDPFFLMTQRADEAKFIESYYAGMPLEQLKAEFHIWSQRRIWVNDATGVQRVRNGERAHELVCEWAAATIWPELTLETSLDGFSLGEFRSVYAGLIVNCAFIAWGEDLQDSGPRKGPRMSSRVIALSQEQMVEWLTDISGVQAGAAAEILGLLTLNAGDYLPQLGYQPFVRSRGGRYFLLPRFIIYSGAPRTLSQSLNTGSRKHVFAGFGEAMTKRQHKAIADVFTESGYDVLNDRRLRSNGREIKPDLIVFDRANDYLLIADYKNMINPLGPAQAISNMINIRGYAVKILKYLEFIEANLSIVRKWIPALPEKPQVSGMLLFREPMGLPLDRVPRVEMANWFALEKHLSEGGSEGLPGLVEWAATRPDTGINPKDYILRDYSIRIGDWLYIGEKIAQVDWGRQVR